MLSRVSRAGGSFGYDKAVLRDLLLAVKQQWRDETSMVCGVVSFGAIIYTLLSSSLNSFEVSITASMLSFLYFMKKLL